MRACQQTAATQQKNAVAAVQSARHSFSSLQRQRPELVVAGHAGTSLLPALLYRWFQRDTRLLVWSNGVPPIWRWTRLMALHLADGVLVRNEVDAQAVTTLRKSGSMVFSVPGPYDIGDFLELPPDRSGHAAYRIVVSGALAPGVDAMTILHTVADWAEQHPERRIDLCWIGNGNLRHVLAAQSLPANLFQCFPGELTASAKQREFARSGVLIATASHLPAAERELHVAEAMASGLVVLFDHATGDPAGIVQEGLSGIGYDATRPASLSQAIARVMAEPEAALNAMRRAVRMRIKPMDIPGFAARFDHAVAAVMRGETGGTHATGVVMAQ